ncbi:MAG: class I SAM-dependent methyltransferase [Chthoniobacterales bacterium]
MISVFRHAELDSTEKSVLQQRLLEYYSNPPESYYTIADQAALQYTPDLQPFHCDLASRVKAGMKVLELGCGTAHLCPFVEAHGAFYTGMDCSDKLLDRNHQKFPSARFLLIGTDPGEAFDIVASLYTIEHIVDPAAYLEQMWALCKPAGLLAVICPEFIDSDCYPPSFYYGKTTRRFREKARSLNLIDMFLHIVDLKWNAPRWKKRARRSEPGAFWINLCPSELSGMSHGVDTDAVYLSRLADLTWWLETRGAKILATSGTIAGAPREVLRFNCYVVAQKP